MIPQAPAGYNLAAWLRLRSEQSPASPALHYPSGRDAQGVLQFACRTFLQLDRESDACAWGLGQRGLERGMKTVLLVRPGRELFVVLLAMFKLGAVAIVVDPGMGLRRMLHCYRSASAEAFIGIPAAHAVRVLHPGVFGSLRTLVTVGRRRGWGGSTLEEVEACGGEGPFPLQEVAADDPLIINFTTGSTGPAKGVVYTHATVRAMLGTILEHFPLQPSDTSLVTLTLLGVFDVLLGSVAVLAPMDPARPADADPALLSSVLTRFRATQMFASPALLHRLAVHARAHGTRLPTLRRVIAGGAPVSPVLVGQLREVLEPQAQIHVTYGATEALPIASIEAGEILNETASLTRAGRGSCVGRPVGETEICIARIVDGPLADSPLTGSPLADSNGLEVPGGEVGEILVRGPLVSPRYYANPGADALAKIPTAGGTWHRTGDLGWRDGQGRLWLAGRKSQRIETQGVTLHTVQWEGIFDAQPGVYRSALVGVGPAGVPKDPVLCVEASEGLDAASRSRLPEGLAQVARDHGLRLRSTLLHPGFPVDLRHNAKIHREELAAWAEARLGIQGEATAPERRGRLLWLIPIGGWLFLVYGALWPFSSVVVRGVWLFDLFLSVVVHGVQLFWSLPAGRRAGLGLTYTVLMTFLLGATWWRPIEARGARTAT